MVNVLGSLSKGATLLTVIVLTGFFSSLLIVAAIWADPQFLYQMYSMGIWPLAYIFIGINLLATVMVVLLIWLITRKRVSVGELIAE